MKFFIFNRLRLILIFTVAVLAAQTFNPIYFGSIFAKSQPDGWSWTSGKPTVVASNIINSQSSTGCSGSIQMREIAGETEQKQICITTDDGVKFGLYSTGNYIRAAIGFSMDDKMYPIFTSCDTYSSCLYSQATDTLIMHPYIRFWWKGMNVYRNFSKRIVRQSDVLGMTVGYDFDASNPDYVFSDINGYANAVGGMGLSKNGRWLAFEICDNGIGIMDLENLQSKRVTAYSPLYGYGSNPSSEIGVSNDGRNIAFMGLNSGIKVISVNDDCGQTPVNIGVDRTMVKGCPHNEFDTNPFINNFFVGSNPIFSEDGGILDFFATSYNGEKRAVSLAASKYSAKRMDYLALGDSFTSGEGETDDKYYLAGTNDEYEKCHVSMNSYPFLIADSMGIDVPNMANVACSAARMGDVVGYDANYLGQGKRLGKNKLKLNDADTVLAKNNALYSLLPGRIHQESFVKQYRPKSITISIGGNDAGLIDKLVACLSHNTCSWANTTKGKEQTALEIKGLFSKLQNTYQKIHDDSPDSRIFVVGYPKIIDENNKCNLVNGYMLDSTERRFMNESITYMNSVISAAAKAAGVKYVDIEDSFDDHVLCGSKEPSAMNAIRFGDDITVIDKLPNFKPIGNESFHPNALGHSYTAKMITDDVNDIITYNYCMNGETICPEDNVAAPEPSEYWIPESIHDYPSLKNISFVSDDVNGKNNRQRRLSLSEGTLQPDSSIKVEITSEPELIGNYTATSDGSFAADIELPLDLDYGYHTIHLYGTSFSGESIELYEAISYEAPKSTPAQQIVESEKLVASTVSNRGASDAIEHNNEPFTESISYGTRIKDTINASDSDGNVKGLIDKNSSASTSATTATSKSANGPKSDFSPVLIVASSLLLTTTLAILVLRKFKG